MINIGGETVKMYRILEKKLVSMKTKNTPSLSQLIFDKGAKNIHQRQDSLQ